MKSEFPLSDLVELGKIRHAALLRILNQCINPPRYSGETLIGRVVERIDERLYSGALNQYMPNSFSQLSYPPRGRIFCPNGALFYLSIALEGRGWNRSDWLCLSGETMTVEILRGVIRERQDNTPLLLVTSLTSCHADILDNLYRKYFPKDSSAFLRRDKLTIKMLQNVLPSFWSTSKACARNIRKALEQAEYPEDAIRIIFERTV